RESPLPNLANLTDITFRRFPNFNDVPYERMIALYDVMGIGHNGYFPRRGQWVEAIFAAWLQQTQPNFSRNREVAFADFQINILPYDFNEDGQNEYVLDVNKGKLTNRHDCRYDAEYVNYLVVKVSESGYELIETPLYWEGYGTDSAVTNFG